MSRDRDGHSVSRRLAVRLGLVSDQDPLRGLSRQQRRLIHRAVEFGLPVPPHLAGPAVAYARRCLRLFTWVGAGCLLCGLGWLAVAIRGGRGNPEWLRWLFAAGYLSLAAGMLFVRYNARRTIRAHHGLR